MCGVCVWCMCVYGVCVCDVRVCGVCVWCVCVVYMCVVCVCVWCMCAWCVCGVWLCMLDKEFSLVRGAMTVSEKWSLNRSEAFIRVYLYFLSLSDKHTQVM